MDQLSKSKTKLLDTLEDVIGTNNLIKLDNYLGLRGWGILLYGILPSNLVFLKTFDLNMSDRNDLLIVSILVASLLPIIIIFMLVKKEIRKWYLTPDSLNCRSATITILIVTVSTSIIGCSGIVQGKYVFSMPEKIADLNAIAECFFLAILTMLISSSLFTLAFIRKTDLPGLPSLEYENSIETVNNNIRKIKSTEILEQFIIFENSLIYLVEETEKALDNIISSKGNTIAKKSLKTTHEDVSNLLKALKEIKNRSGNQKLEEKVWKRYFDASSELTDEEKIRRERKIAIFKSVQRLKSLEIGD